MELEELKLKSCKFASGWKKRYNGMQSLPIPEQEIIISNTRDENMFRVDCTHQNFITKLAKSELFTVQEVLVSNINKEFVLGIQGSLELTGITIKKRKKVLSHAQVSLLKERMLNLQRIKQEKAQNQNKEEE